MKFWYGPSGGSPGCNYIILEKVDLATLDTTLSLTWGNFVHGLHHRGSMTDRKQAEATVARDSAATAAGSRHGVASSQHAAMSAAPGEEGQRSQGEGSIDELCINTIRTLSMDAVQQANSGHPGTPMALAPVVYTLWQRFLRFDPERSDLAQPRPLRAVQRPRLDAALCDAASRRREGGRCRIRASRRARGHARRHQAVSASSAANAPAIPNIA